MKLRPYPKANPRDEDRILVVEPEGCPEPNEMETPVETTDTEEHAEPDVTNAYHWRLLYSGWPLPPQPTAQSFSVTLPNGFHWTPNQTRAGGDFS